LITPTDSKGLVGTPGKFIVNIIEPGLNLEKICFAKGTQNECKTANLKIGDPITYKITASNSSSVILQNLKIIDDYDQVRIADITNISDSGQLSASEGKIFWNSLGTLAGSGSKSVTFDAKIAQGAAAGAEIKNIATAMADGVDDVQKEYIFNLPQAGQIDSALTKSCVKENNQDCSTGVIPGQLVKYTVNFTNTSSQTAINVKIVDQYDGGRLVNVRDISDAGVLNQEASTITWQAGNIAAGQSKQVTFVANTRNNLPNGTIVNNLAIATGDNIPEKRANKDFPITIPLAPVTPRTGGGIAIMAVIISIAMAGGGYWYYKNSQKFAKGFVPGRTQEDKINSVNKSSKRKHIKSANRNK